MRFFVGNWVAGGEGFGGPFGGGGFGEPGGGGIGFRGWERSEGESAKWEFAERARRMRMVQ